MNNWQWKVFSVLTILAMALAMCPPTAVGAAWGEGTITGNINVANTGLNLSVRAYPVGGSDEGICISDWVNYNTNHYEYSIGGCDPDLDYTVVAEGDGYTFNSVSVTTFTGTPPNAVATAPAITPVSRTFTGSITKSDGVTPWVGFVVDYERDGTPGTATTNGSGVFTIPSLTDATTLFIPPMEADGYRFEHGDLWFNPPWRSDVIFEFRSTGIRNAHGYIDSVNGLKGCTSGVTITAAAPGALTQTTLTDGDNGFGLNNLEALNTYVVTPSKPGCVFTPASRTIDVRNGNGQQPIIFYVPDSGIWGKVTTALGKDVSLAYYLIATYTTSDGVSYSNAVNWTNGEYWLQVPPSSGTLTISRVGGPAAFGYETASATRSVTVANVWKEESFTLVPARTISGKIMGQNSVPVQKNATVDLGYGLKWTPATPTTTYSIKAQPKLYYLSPVENGIISSTPVRYLANLTTAASVTTANFTLNLKTYWLEGCLWDFNGNDALVLGGPVAPTLSTSVRFRPATGYGTTTYPATLYKDGCGFGSYYYEVKLPKGIAGALEADGHTLRGNTIDGMNWNDRKDYNLMGNRAITGRIYSPNMNLNINGDLYGGNGIFTLREAATNYVVETDLDLQRSFEFTVPMLEAKAYTLSINPNQVPNGYVAQPFPMSPMVAANLTSADYDVPAATGFVLTHAPIDPYDPDRPADGYTGRPATGGGYFQATNVTQNVQWAYPPMNGADWFQGFEYQVGPATAAFSDTSPAPVFIQPNGDPAYTFGGLTVGTLYRWRVRAVFENDKGPWLDTAPVPTTPVLTAGSNYMPGAAAGQVTFEWNEVIPDTYGGILKYVVQYSNNAAFSAVAPNVAVTLPATTDPFKTTTTAPTIGTTYYWRVKVQNPSGVDISGWSPTQMFFNRYKNINAGPTYAAADFDSIQFFAASANTTLPANAHYQVWLSSDGFSNDFFAWTFPKTANLATPSVRQFPNSLPSGTYDWKIVIVNGNDGWAPWITDWVDGTGTINVP